MRSAAAVIVFAALASAFVSACSTTTKIDDSSVPAISSTTAPASPTPQRAAIAIKAVIPEITALIPLTETNDTNNLIGRSKGYSAATVIVDSRTSEACSTDKPGVDCGATIEQWPDSAAAQKRADYVEAMRGELPPLGQEFSAVKGGLLLRVAGTLEPSVAETYKAAFLQAG